MVAMLGNLGVTVCDSRSFGGPLHRSGSPRVAAGEKLCNAKVRLEKWREFDRELDAPSGCGNRHRELGREIR